MKMNFTEENIGDQIKDPKLLSELTGIPERLIDGNSLEGWYEIVGFVESNGIEVIHEKSHERGHGQGEK